MSVVSTKLTATYNQIKYYLEGSGQSAGAVTELLQRVVKELADEWMESDKNGLGRP